MLVVSGAPRHKDGLSAYQQYLRFLHRKMPRLTDQELFEAPYWDYLQAPLQPLMDNLESQTYETFERDPIKYRDYERAVYEGSFWLLDQRFWSLFNEYSPAS